jgi:hypothetical protein
MMLHGMSHHGAREGCDPEASVTRSRMARRQGVEHEHTDRSLRDEGIATMAAEGKTVPTEHMTCIIEYCKKSDSRQLPTCPWSPMGRSSSAPLGREKERIWSTVCTSVLAVSTQMAINGVEVQHA